MNSAPLIWKDILHAGRVHVPHPSRPDAMVPLDIKPSDVANACRIGNLKAAADWHTPACWEHDDAARPERAGMLSEAARRAKSVFGFAKRYRLRDDPEKGQVLQAALGVDDTADRAQLAKTKFVSPYIQWDWQNPGTGETWPGLSVLHIAATPMPRQGNQEPFALSRGEAAKTMKGPFRLSYGDGEMEGQADANVVNPADATGGMVPPTSFAGFPELLDMVGNWGIVMPSDTTPDNFAERLYAALKQSDTPPPPNPDQEAESAPPIQSAGMSAAEAKVAQKVTAMHRTLLSQEVADLLKRGAIDPKLASDLTKQVREAKLSFGNDGELDRRAAVVVVEIDAYKKLPKGASWSPKAARLSRTPFEAVELPAELAGDTTADEDRLADEIADRFRKK